MKEKINVLKKLLILNICFILMPLGIVLCIKAAIGVSPWDVFHQGLAKLINMPLGQTSIIVGLVILVIATSLKVYPGIGTILNTIVMGFAVDIWMPLIPSPNNLFTAILMLTIGIIIQAFFAALYLYMRLGAGARDSFMIGITQKFGIDVKYVKPGIEIFVIISGIILGGNFGIGTFIILFSIGYLMDVFFLLLKYDPKIGKHTHLLTQIKAVQRIFF